jgi:uncharacterized membrane protein
LITTRLAESADLPAWVMLIALALGVLSLVLLLVEMRRRERGGAAIFVTGLLAVLALILAIMRPVRIAAKESVVGARVVVLADTSRSMALPDGRSKTRALARDGAIRALEAHAGGARLLVLGFGDGAPVPMDLDGAKAGASPGAHSDLAAALRSLATSAEERPQAVIVVSDGRLDDPPEGATKEALAGLAKTLGVPIHTIATTHDAPRDASIRRVASSGAAVAHVPFPLHVEVGCAGGLACDELTVSARELREDGPPALLASGLVHVTDGKGAVDLTVTLERAGTRILEVAVAAPTGDTIPENDRRLLAFDVARERVRVLHVAGRPTDDVRALREWLKSDASVDVVAFFILRTPTDDPHTLSQDELSLIPFPVDELFTEHLPSFDAVVLQDFDAQPYGLEKHLPALARYVRDGGGLIMVGGPNSFVGGGYADSPLGNATGVLPVQLDGHAGASANDTTTFDANWTAQGKVAPLLAPLRAIVGDELPAMPGANILGDAHPGSVVLWTHPTRVTPSGAPMPILAVGEEGDGRTIALGVDGGWRLEFSALGARTAGRGYGALWDGLLGWLMRDPRFEPAQIELPFGCTAGIPSTLRAHLLPSSGRDAKEALSLDVVRLDRDPSGAKTLPVHREVTRDATGITEVTLPAMPAGAYVARLKVGTSGTTRHELACEAGGDEWADSRPDGERLQRLAAAAGGVFAWADENVTKLPMPKPTRVSAERHVVPIAPPWVWTILATLLLGAHWIARRRGGLS